MVSTELVRFTVREAGTVVFEVEEPTAGIGEASRTRRIRDAKAAFEEHLADVRDAAASALEIMRTAGPDEVKIGFGVKFTVEAGAVVARTTGEGHLDVELTWRRKASPPGSETEQPESGPEPVSRPGPSAVAGP
jgi:hypothetical protein